MQRRLRPQPGEAVREARGLALAPGFIDMHSHAGAGLGLSLVRRLARAAGGEVEAREHSGGASFVVRLPAI